MTAAEQARSSAERLGARYRRAVANATPWNATLETLLDHRSVRAYRPDPLPGRRGAAGGRGPIRRLILQP